MSKAKGSPKAGPMQPFLCVLNVNPVDKAKAARASPKLDYALKASSRIIL